MTALPASSQPDPAAQDGDLSPGVRAALFAPIEAPTAFEETVERLGSAIRLGILPAGRRLPAERELAERLQISRGTLRQALTALIQSGLLMTRRGRGGGTWVATELPPLAPPDGSVSGDWRDVIDLRLAVEAGVVLLAARRATEPHLETLADVNAELAAVVQRDAPFGEYRRADIRFHLMLADASGSEMLMCRMTEVQADMTELIGRGRRPPIILQRAVDQHDAIIRALRRRDAGAAAALMFEHIESTRLILEGLGSR